MRNAAPAGPRNGVEEDQQFPERQLHPIYPSFGFSATDFTIAIIAARHRLSPPIARAVVELAGMGGRQ
jgi:hypothetical protein